MEVKSLQTIQILKLFGLKLNNFGIVLLRNEKIMWSREKESDNGRNM